MGNVLFEDTLLDISGSGITGSAGLGIIVRRVADDSLYDFNDATFKNVGWTTERQAMVEIDAVNLPGSYELSVTVTGWNDGEYVVYYDYDGSDVGLTQYRVPSSFWVRGGVEAGAIAMRGTDGANTLVPPTLAEIIAGIMGETVDGTLDLQKTLQVLLAIIIAKRCTRVDNVYTYYDQSGNVMVTVTYADPVVTVVIAP